MLTLTNCKPLVHKAMQLLKPKWAKLKRNWLIISMTLLVLLAIYISYGSYTAYTSHVKAIYATQAYTNPGPVTGEWFSAISNPVIYFIGLLLLLATLYQSHKELSLTRQANQEVKASLEDQALTQRQQRFENTFFALLEQHNKLLERLEEKTIEIDINWKKLFKEDTLNLPIAEKAKQELYELLASKNGFLLRNYFMALYQLLKFVYSNQARLTEPEHKLTPNLMIDTTTITPQEDFYVKLIFSYISEATIRLILINCLVTSEGKLRNYPKFKALIERYNLFKNLSLNSSDEAQKRFFEQIIDDDCYLELAFKRNEEYLIVRNRDKSQDQIIVYREIEQKWQRIATLTTAVATDIALTIAPNVTKALTDN